MENYIIDLTFFNSDKSAPPSQTSKKNSVYGFIQDGPNLYRVYTSQLFQILSNNKIPCHSSGEFNGCTFKNMYIKGYEEGQTDFRKEYLLSPDILFSNAEKYIQNLRLCYFHKAPNLDKGWNYWINSYPIIVNDKTIHLYGYVAGIRSEIEMQQEQYPLIYKKFEECPENEITEQKLDSLTVNNTIFERILIDFEEKIKTISQFMSEVEFLKEEIKRVENEYSNPQIQILSSSHPIRAQFSYSKYTKEAFIWLKRGQNWPLKNILANAETQYRDAYKDSPVLIEYHFQSGEFEKAILASLREGVAWLMYIKHLKELLGGRNQVDHHVLEPMHNSKAFLQPIDPLTLIDPALLSAFLSVEKKATLNTGKFESAIRCAAFCELLYKKRYIINIKNQNQKQMNSFAKGRYGVNITNSLATKDKTDRERHQNNTVKGLRPLKHSFD